MKTSTIVEVSPQKSYYSKGAQCELYPFNLRMENADVGQYSSKSQSPEWIGIGREVNYEITREQYGNKIKLVQGQQQQGGSVQHSAQIPAGQQKQDYQKSSYQQEPIETKFIGMAMGYTKDLTVANIWDGIDLEDHFNDILNIMLRAKDRVLTESAPPKQQDKMEQFTQQQTPPQSGDFMDGIPMPEEPPY